MGLKDSCPASRSDRIRPRDVRSARLESISRGGFRPRAVAAGAVVFAPAVLSLALSARVAPLVFDGLTQNRWSIALHLATAARLRRGAGRAHRGRVGRVAVPVPRRTRRGRSNSASGPRSTQVALLVALAIGALTLFPSLYLLFRVFKGERPLSVVDRPPVRRT